MTNINTDPFELNTSIWNSPPTSNNSDSYNQQQTANNPAKITTSPKSSISGSKFLLSNTQFNPGVLSTGNTFGNTTSIPQARRASFNDCLTNNPNNTNYTFWSNDMNNMSQNNDLLWQSNFLPQSVQQQQQFNNGMFNQPPPPPQPQQQQQLQPPLPQPNQFNQFNNHSSVSAIDNNYNSMILNSRRHSYTPPLKIDPIFQEETFSNDASSITESNQFLINAYKSVDYYFTNDYYNRVAINHDSINNLSNDLEELIKSGIQLPKFSNNSNNSISISSLKIVLISFKAGRIDVFYLPENSKLKLKINDLVFVEADRGCDLGKVIKLDVSIDEARMLKYLQHQEQQAALASFENNESNSPHSSSVNENANNNANMPALHFPKPILRLALPNEIQQTINKQNDEEKAKKICLLKIETSNLSMNVIDAEYQWDRRKLTFYYNASQRIDFRDLVRELFRIYKTRIWMCAVNKNSLTVPKIIEPNNYSVVNDQNNTTVNNDSSFATEDFSINQNWTSPLQSHPDPNFQFQSLEQNKNLLIPRQFTESGANW